MLLQLKDFAPERVTSSVSRSALKSRRKRSLDMQIDWPILIGASLLLFFPASWIYPAAAKERLSTYQSGRFRFGRMLGTWQHWFDLIRACAGTYLLVEFAVLIDTEFVVEPSEKYLRWGLIGVILTLAVIRQTVQHRQVFYFTAPVFYLWGITIALMDPFPAAFSIIFSSLFARSLDHVELKLPTMAVLLGVSVYLISGFSFLLALNVFLIVLPLFIAVASMGHLVCYVRGLT